MKSFLKNKFHFKGKNESVTFPFEQMEEMLVNFSQTECSWAIPSLVYSLLSVPGIKSSRIVLLPSYFKRKNLGQVLSESRYLSLPPASDEYIIPYLRETVIFSRNVLIFSKKECSRNIQCPPEIRNVLLADPRLSIILLPLTIGDFHYGFLHLEWQISYSQAETPDWLRLAQLFERQLSCSLSNSYRDTQYFFKLTEDLNQVYFVFSPDFEILYFVSPGLPTLFRVSEGDTYRYPLKFMENIHISDRELLIPWLMDQSRSYPSNFDLRVEQSFG